MAANGVIGITASILESSDIPESENNPENQLSFFERIKGWVKGLRKNWKGMVKKGATVGFYALLAGSKIMQGITQSMFRVVGGLIDVLLAPMIPFISKGINWLADIVRAVGDFIKNMPETFKKIWNPIWNWITKLASSAGETLLNLFIKKGEEKLSESDRNKEVQKVLGSDQGAIVGPEEKAGFLDGNAKGYASLIDEPINDADVAEARDLIEENLRDVMPSDAEVTEVHQSYVDEIEGQLALPSEERVAVVQQSYIKAIQDQYELPTEAEVIAVQKSYADALAIPEDYDPRGPLTWMEKGTTEETFPGGPIREQDTRSAIYREDITIIDEKVDGEEEFTKWYDSWRNNIPKFSWSDLWTDLVPEEFDPVGSIVEMWNNATSVTKEDMVLNMIDVAIEGPPVPRVPIDPGLRGTPSFPGPQNPSGLTDHGYIFIMMQYVKK